LTSNQKLASMLLGVVSAFLIVAQLVLGELIRRGENLRDIHRRSGHLTFVVIIVYIFMTLWFLINTPTRPKNPRSAESQ
jgi:predicted permease